MSQGKSVVILALQFILILSQFHLTHSRGIFERMLQDSNAIGIGTGTGTRNNNNRNQALDNDTAVFGAGFNFARLFQDFLRIFNSAIVTVNLNFMGEQANYMHRPEPHPESKQIALGQQLEPSQQFQPQPQQSATQQRVERMGDPNSGKISRPLEKPRVSWWPWKRPNLDSSSDLGSGSGSKRVFKPFAIFGR